MTDTRPDDLNVKYMWREGSVPPPYHYEYAVSVSGSGEGGIAFWPDYPEHGVDPWEEHFAVAKARLDELHATMVACGVFERDWEELEDPPVGGEFEWLEATADGRQARVPSTLKHPEAVEPVYELVRSLVPEAIWTGLMRRFEAGGD